MYNKTFKILLAEDDPNLGILVSEYLTTEGFEIVLCRDGEIALQRFKENKFNLCLLDVMMPKINGFDLAAAIRLLNKKVPIIFVTAKSLKVDKLKGYSLAIDDYITKPFDEEELLWKINAIKRRMYEYDEERKLTILSIGNYQFDFQNQCLTINDTTKRITEKECEILFYFINHANTLVKRGDLLHAIWGENDYFLGRSLDVFITKIRKYLSADDRLGIENVFGVGFIFKLPQN
jgi:DNA-binding response OmpR family regulator